MTILSVGVQNIFYIRVSLHVTAIEIKISFA